VNLERIIIVYDLMMGKVIENTDISECKMDSSPEEALALFAERMTGTVKHSWDEILSVLKYEIAEGNLILLNNDGKFSLKWVDYL